VTDIPIIFRVRSSCSTNHRVEKLQASTPTFVGDTVGRIALLADFHALFAFARAGMEAVS
jgi:hypothetical protein